MKRKFNLIESIIDGRSSKNNRIDLLYIVDRIYAQLVTPIFLTEVKSTLIVLLNKFLLALLNRKVFNTAEFAAADTQSFMELRQYLTSVSPAKRNLLFALLPATDKIYLKSLFGFDASALLYESEKLQIDFIDELGTILGQSYQSILHSYIDSSQVTPDVFIDQRMYSNTQLMTTNLPENFGSEYSVEERGLAFITQETFNNIFPHISDRNEMSVFLEEMAKTNSRHMNITTQKTVLNRFYLSKEYELLSQRCTEWLRKASERNAPNFSNCSMTGLKHWFDYFKGQKRHHYTNGLYFFNGPRTAISFVNSASHNFKNRSEISLRIADKWLQGVVANLSNQSNDRELNLQILDEDFGLGEILFYLQHGYKKAQREFFDRIAMLDEVLKAEIIELSATMKILNNSRILLTANQFSTLFTFNEDELEQLNLILAYIKFAKTDTNLRDIFPMLLTLDSEDLQELADLLSVVDRTNGLKSANGAALKMSKLLLQTLCALFRKHKSYEEKNAPASLGIMIFRQLQKLGILNSNTLQCVQVIKDLEILNILAEDIMPMFIESKPSKAVIMQALASTKVELDLLRQSFTARPVIQNQVTIFNRNWASNISVPVQNADDLPWNLFNYSK